MEVPMKVSSLLDNKNQHIISVSPDTEIGEVAEILRQHRIGAVIVLNGPDDIAGVLSERDIVRAVAEHGSPCLEFKAEQLMTKDVIRCALEDSIDRVMELMTEHRFRHLPVMDDRKLIGMISIGDVVKHKIEQVEAEAQQMRSYIATA